MKWDWVWLALALGLAVGGVLYYNTQDSQSVNTEDGTEVIRVANRTKSCRSLAGEPEARFDACTAELGKLSMTSAATAAYNKYKESRKAFSLVPLGADAQVATLEGHSDIRSALLGTDESKAAKVLRGQDFRLLVVPRDYTEAMDRDSRVIARLAHHDHIEYFQLRYIGQNVMIYSVRDSSVRMPLKTGESLIAGLRARLFNKPIPRQSWTPSNVRLLGTLRTRGDALVIRHESGGNIENVLDGLASEMRRRWERDVETKGQGPILARERDILVEVQIVMERARVEPRDRGAIFEIFEMGVDGALFQHKESVAAKDQKFSYMPGSELVTHSWKSVDQMLQEMVKQFGWSDRRPWQDTQTRLDLIRTQHFAEITPGGEVQRMLRGLPEVTMASLTDTKIRDMLVNGGEWWLNNLNPDNSFEYKYWPTQNRRSDDYNEVRHILAARDLSDVWRYRNDPRYLVGAERSMEWLMRYAIDGDAPPDPTANLAHPAAGSLLFRYPSVKEFTNRQTKKQPNQKLGTVAVALLGWVAWADSTGSHARDAEIRKMAKYVASQQDAEGKFEAYNVPRGHSYYGNKNDIVPGEAALALGMVGEYFNEPEWLDMFPKFLDFYMPWFRERAVRKNPYGRWPHATYSDNDRLDLVQFGPWSVMAAKQYYKLRGDERAAAFGLEVADWMIDNYQWTEGRTAFPDYIGGYYKMQSELPAMQTFCYSEGTAAAYTIAAKFSPQTKDKYDNSTREAIRFLDVMQFDQTDSAFVARPLKVFGGIKYTMNENKVRIDYVGHGLSTLSQYLDARELDPAVTLQVPDPKELDPIHPIPGRRLGQPVIVEESGENPSGEEE